MKAICAPLIGLTLAACGSSPPTRFYSLEPTAAQGSIPVPVPIPLKVDAVHVPSVLDRRTMVRGESHYQLTISSQDRWGGDFGEMARRVLTQDLQERLPVGMVIAPNAPAPANARGIVVDILSFEPNGSGAVTLDAGWVVLQGSPPKPELQRNLHLSEPYEGSAASQAAAMSRLVGRLADNIAQALRAGRLVEAYATAVLLGQAAEPPHCRALERRSSTALTERRVRPAGDSWLNDKAGRLRCTCP